MTPTDDKPVANFGRGSLATKRGLTIANDLPFTAWLEIGKHLFQLVDASGWWIGDWLFFGQWTYGKKYIEAGEVTGLDMGSLRNLSYVAGRFDLSRRRDKLTVAHHSEVASLKPADADQLLDQAEAENWTRNQLREKAREHRVANIATKPAAVEATEDRTADVDERIRQAVDNANHDRLEFRLVAPRQRFERWSAAAASAGKDIDAWAADILDAAAVLAAA